MAEFQRIKELKPDMPELEITEKLFEMEPLSHLPLEDKQAIINKNPNPMQALHFVDRHYDSYKKHLKQKSDYSQFK